MRYHYICKMITNTKSQCVQPSIEQSINKIKIQTSTNQTNLMIINIIHVLICSITCFISIIYSFVSSKSTSSTSMSTTLELDAFALVFSLARRLKYDTSDLTMIPMSNCHVGTHIPNHLSWQLGMLDARKRRGGDRKGEQRTVATENPQREG